MKKLIYITVLSLAIFSCDDPIDVTLPKAKAPIVVDAWLYQNTDKQTITISTANPYFNTKTPVGITDAKVEVKNLLTKKVYTFTHQSNGTYSWTPKNNIPFGIVNNPYELNIEFKGKKITAQTYIARTTKVDSITFSQEIDKGQKGQIRAELWAQDLLDKPDFYWIKTWKNGKFLGKPKELLISQDGAFNGRGEDKDKKDKDSTFIAPIRRGVNPRLENDATEDTPIYSVGDSIYVQINSLTFESFFYLNALKEQIDREGGFSALFAKPISNLNSNLKLKGEGRVVGFFNISAQKGMGMKVTKDIVIVKEKKKSDE